MNLNLDRRQWKRVKFGDVVQQSKEKVDPRDGTVSRVVAGEHMDSNELKIHRWGYVDEGYLGPAFHRRFRPGQVLYGSRRTYLRKVAVADFDGVCSNTTFVLSSKDTNELLDGYLPWVMTSEPFHAFAVAESKGSVNPYVNFSDISKYEFELPPIAHQQQIADLLWAIEQSAQDERKLHQRSDDVLRAARNEGLCSMDAAPAILEDALMQITAGRSLQGNSERVSSGRRGVLKVSAVGPTGFVAEENKELLDQDSFLSRYALKSGDLLVTRANTAEYVGRPAIVDCDYPNLMLSDKTLRLEVNPKIARVEFLLEVLLSARVRAAIASAATGTGAAMKNISQEQLRSIPVPLPQLGIQDAFLARLDTIRQAVEATSSATKVTNSLKHKIMNEVLGS